LVLWLFVFLLTMMTASGQAQSVGTITTIAGDGFKDDTGSGRFAGDDGQATSASFNGSRGIAVDGSGNLYVADYRNHRIRKVSPTGIITTVAGALAGFSGDGGPATSAALLFPLHVCLDGSGNLYIADSGNNRIRMVDASGMITTVAGNGTEISAGDGGQATAASLHSPNSVFVDGSGNLYITEFSFRVRKVDANGTITTVAGDGFKNDNGSGRFTGDGGQATAASLYYPGGVFMDGSGNLYISDSGNHRIRKVDASGMITTVAGNGTAAFAGDGGSATAAGLAPVGIFIDESGNLYIADRGNNRIRKVDASGMITTVAGNGTQGFSGDGGPATAASFNSPVSVFIDGAGNLYISDGGNYRIRKVTWESPTAVGLATFVAYEDHRAVRIVWMTTANREYAGFNLYRSLRPYEGFERLNRTLITGQHRFQYMDREVQANQMYYYRLEAVGVSGETTLFGPIVARVGTSRTFALHQNTPNPFNPATAIRFDLPAPGRVTLRIYNLHGQEIATLLEDEFKPAGSYTLWWDGRDARGARAASGVYLYRLKADSFVETKKMLLLK
jgi:sugar lactone lactonase YvrE